ncbi:DUF6193 family natural product biosynthesis protein [Streptomyces sp. NPDC005571]|uniref:DUF6193 family natural product biosynthesis protein n=2 Tax=Streptomyces TaxID=1883 RepID=UPI0033A96312
MCSGLSCATTGCSPLPRQPPKQPDLGIETPLPGRYGAASISEGHRTMDPERESRDSVEAEWDFQARAATQWDERSRGSATTWVPPIMGALVDAARNSTLGRFYPFTSHARLCFSTGRRHWLGEGNVLPVCIALLPGGSYSVAQKHDPTEILLETTSAEESVATTITALQEYLQA